MEKATIESMEMGNLIFGNSRGEYHVEPREDYQEAFCNFLKNNGFEFDGYYGKQDKFENDTFIIRPYYWGNDDKLAELPNFVYKPTGLEISWYKYPMRDAYSNQDVSIEQFRAILKACALSMKEGKRNG